MKRFFSFLFLVVFTAYAETDRMDESYKKVGEIYFKEALMLLQENKKEDAIQSASKAYEFDKENPNFLFFLGKFFYEKKELIKAKYFFEETLLHKNELAGFSFGELVDKYSDILVLAKEYEKAKNFLETYSSYTFFSKHATYNYVKSLIKIGNKELAAIYFNKIKNSGINYMLYDFYIKELNKFNVKDFLLIEDETKNSPEYMQLFKTFLSLTPPGEYREFYTKKYMDLDGNPISYSYYLEDLKAQNKNSLETELGILKDFLQKKGMQDKIALEKLFYAIEYQENANYLSNELSNIDFVSYANRDDDYIAEEKYAFSKGKLTEWEYDKNQDGFADVKIYFKNRIPTNLIYKVKYEDINKRLNNAKPLDNLEYGVIYNYKYGVFPNITNFSIQDEKIIKNMFFSKNILNYDLINLNKKNMGQFEFEFLISFENMNIEPLYNRDYTKLYQLMTSFNEKENFPYRLDIYDSAKLKASFFGKTENFEKHQKFTYYNSNGSFYDFTDFDSNGEYDIAKTENGTLYFVNNMTTNGFEDSNRGEYNFISVNSGVNKWGFSKNEDGEELFNLGKRESIRMLSIAKEKKTELY